MEISLLWQNWLRRQIVLKFFQDKMQTNQLILSKQSGFYVPSLASKYTKKAGLYEIFLFGLTIQVCIV